MELKTNTELTRAINDLTMEICSIVAQRPKPSVERP